MSLDLIFIEYLFSYSHMYPLAFLILTTLDYGHEKFDATIFCLTLFIYILCNWIDKVVHDRRNKVNSISYKAHCI